MTPSPPSPGSSLPDPGIEAAGHDVLVITFREDRPATESVLREWNIPWNRLVTSTLDACLAVGVDQWKASECRKAGVETFLRMIPTSSGTSIRPPSACNPMCAPNRSQGLKRPFLRRSVRPLSLCSPCSFEKGISPVPQFDPLAAPSASFSSPSSANSPALNLLTRPNLLDEQQNLAIRLQHLQPVIRLRQHHKRHRAVSPSSIAFVSAQALPRTPPPTPHTPPCCKAP